MKRIFTIAFMLMFCAVIYAQDQEPKSDEIKSLLDDVKYHGGYLGFDVRYTELDNSSGMQLGGRLGWILNHDLAIGLAGYGFFSQPKLYDVLNNGKDYKLTGGYGGLLIEPIIGSRFPVHASFPVVIGVGGISFKENFEDIIEQDLDLNSPSTAYFIINPGVEIELNLLKHLRFSLGAYYNYTSNFKIDARDANDVEVQVIDQEALNGFNFGASIKIGFF